MRETEGNKANRRTVLMGFSQIGALLYESEPFPNLCSNSVSSILDWKFCLGQSGWGEYHT